MAEAFAGELLTAFEDANGKALRSLVQKLPEFIESLSDGDVEAVCRQVRSVRDYPRTLDFAVIRTEKIVGGFCQALRRQQRNTQIALAETIALICNPDDYKGFVGSESFSSLLDFSANSYNEDAILPLIQCIALYSQANLLQEIGLEPRFLSVLSRILRDCSYEPLILSSFDALLVILNPKSECSLKCACESGLIPTLIIYMGNPNAEIKRRTMVALTAFKDAPYAVTPLATQGIGNLLHGLVSFSDPQMRKMTISLLTAIGESKAEYRDSLIVHNFAPLCVSILSGPDPAIKIDVLHLLSLILKDRQRQQIDELVENNLITVLCRIAQREDALREKAFDCIESILMAGGVDGMYKALFMECRIAKLLLSLRNSQWGDAASRILTVHFPKEVQYNPAQAAPFLRQSQQVAPTPPQAVPNPVIPPAQPQQVPVQPVKKTPNRHPKGKKPAKPAKPAVVPAGKGGVAAGKGVNIARLRATVRSGVTFPIPAIYRRLRMLGYRVSRKSAVFLAAALEYLTAEVLDLAGGETKRMKRVRIQPTDLREALRDEELARLTMDVVLPGADNVTNSAE